MNAYSLAYPIALGLLSRWHGSSIGPRKVYKSLAYATPYALAVALATGDWIATLNTLWLTAAAKSSPHEAFLDDGFKMGELQRTSWVTRITDILTRNHRRDTTLWCSVGWAVKGSFIAFAAAVYLADVYGASAALRVLVCGMLSSVAGYALGWTVLYKRRLEPTQWGELLSGYFAGMGLVV